MNKAIIKTALLPLLILLLITCAHAEETAEEATGVPAINVYLSNAETGSGNANPGQITRISAKVVYEGCAAGEEYSLVLRLEDTASGALCNFSDGNGSLVHSFTAESKAGIFYFEFEIDAVRFSGRTLAELHYLEGMESAYASQSAANNGKIYIPGMRTEAVSTSGEKTVPAGKNSVICDVVSYYGLAPNEEYRVVTGLKDRLTGELIRGEDGNPVSVTSKFTPQEANGQIAVKIKANLREYGNREITVFENIYIIPKTGIPFLLLTSENTSDEYRTVLAGLTDISVLDELYRTPVAGARIRVSSLADGFTYEGVSDGEGKCSFPLDGNERCACTVVSVPEGYLPNGSTVEFVPYESGTDIALSVYLLKKNTIVLKRTDAETGLPLHGIVTEVYSQEGNLLSTIFSDENGMARFDANVCWNQAAEAAKAAGENSFMLTLSFKDISTPSEYFSKEEKWTVSIDENENITGLTDLASYKRHSLSITVVDQKGSGIPGVQITLIGADGSVQGRAVTDPEGRIYFTPKRTGEYIIVEDAVPSGYAGRLRSSRITVNPDGEAEGNLTVTHFSEGFASGIAAVAILTVAFAVVWFSVGFFVKRAIREKVQEGFDKLSGTGMHSK